MDWLNGFWMGSVLCINDNLRHMIRNISIYNPDVMLMVPLMLETIYKRLKSLGSDVPPEAIAQKVFGPKLKRIFTGGAHLDPYYIGEFEKYGIKVYEGYGMSECSPVITNNREGACKPGSIGKALSNAEIKFENGEILVRGTSVMKGYYKMEKETEETLRDGWLHTGDKGYIDEDGFIFINGRVKNLIILSNGENISPEEIEGKLALNDLIGEIVVTGEDNLLTARIYPEKELVANMSEEEKRSAETLDDYELVRVNTAENKVRYYLSPGECRDVNELKIYARQHGYKPGWVYYQLRSRGWLGGSQGGNQAAKRYPCRAV